jgi:hypothetical protein
VHHQALQEMLHLSLDLESGYGKIFFDEIVIAFVSHW